MKSKGRSPSRMLYLAALAIVIALVAAVSSGVAAGSASSGAVWPSSQPAIDRSLTPIQESAPGTPDRSGHERGDCPDKDHGAGAGSGSTTPESTTSESGGSEV